MNYNLETYRDRFIEYKGVVKPNDWLIKLYAVSKNEHFGANEVLDSVLNELPTWTQIAENTPLETYSTGILIVHEAREGVWILFNWWTGGEMVDTRLFFADYETKTITSSAYGNALKCVWEYEIFTHERQAWIDHVLNLPEDPDFEGYVKDGYTVLV